MTRPLLLIGLLFAGIGSTGGDAERPEAGAPAATGPLAVGDAVRPWRLAEWSGTEPLALEDLRGRVVVVRFWTDSCSFCARSLPALQALADEFRDRPVTFVGIYHAKPPDRERPWPSAVAWARRRGVSFPLAYDGGWATLRFWWLEGNDPAATSASFVIDRRGRVALVHPGPEFYPTHDPSRARQDRDFRALRAAIRRALDPE
jgi:peroxiredoxin